MSENIFDKALDILVDSVTDPQDEDDNCYMLNYKEINLIIDTVKEAKKQDKLLKLYRELEKMFIVYIFTSFPNEELKDASWDEIILKKKQIEGLENE